MIFKDHDGLLVGARKGSPLAVGYGDGEAYLGSDAFALAPFTNRVSYLEEGDVVVIRHGEVAIFDAADAPPTARSRSPPPARRWWTRAAMPISWPRKSTNSPK